MTTKTYSIFDPHAVGPAEEIQQGGTIITCNLDAANNDRMVRGDIGFSSGQHRAQFVFYGEGDLAAKASVGIVTDQHPLSQSVGKSVEGYGYRPGDGDIYNANISVATVAPTEKKVYIDVLLDADADTVTFYVNQSEVATVAITSGQTWYFAAGVGATVAYDLSCYVNTGANAFTFTLPDNPGWYTQTSGLGMLYVCDQGGFLTATADTPSNQAFEPRIVQSNQFRISRRCSVWPWDVQNSGATYGSLALDNGDGRFDELLTADPRDALVTLRLVPSNGTYADSFVVGTTNIDSIKSDGEALIRLALSDLLSTIQRPLQTAKFPPFVDEGAANRPIPITVGAVRQVAPVLYDEENRLFKISDQQITNIGVMRDQGDPLDPYGTPPDYTQSADQQDVIPAVMPVGKFTGDFSSLGQTNVIAGADDALAGAGLFTVWTNPANPPDGWTGGGTGSRTREGLAQNMPQNYVAFLASGDPWDPAGDVGIWLKSPTAVLPAGRTVNITFKMRTCTGDPPAFPNGLQYGLRVMSALDNAPSSSISPFRQPLQQPLWRNDDQYTLSYTVPAGADRFLYMVACASTGITANVGVGLVQLRIYGIRVEVLSNTVADIPLQPMTLTQFYTQMIEQRAGLTSSDWVAQDTIDIDDRTGYGYGYHTQDPVTIENALRAPLDSSCSVLLTDHLGRIRVRQLIDPATVDDGDIVMELTNREIAYAVDCEIDVAKGLTTVMGVRKNYYVSTATDFISDASSGGLNYATRAQFSRESQLLQTSTSPLAGFYNFARDAAPVISLMDDPVDGQTEIDRVNSFYSTPPQFYTITVWLSQYTAAAAAQLIFGDVLRVTYLSPNDQVINGLTIPGTIRFGLDSKKVTVVDTELSPADLSIRITCWGGPS